MSPKVYFSPVITPEKVLELLKMADKTLPGNVAIKVHSGEKGNQNFLKPEFWKPVITYVGHRKTPQALCRPRLAGSLHR